MLTPIPGMVHLKVIAPSPTPAALPAPPTQQAQPATDPDAQRRIHALVLVALEIICGMRPEERLDKRRYAPPARRHISERFRQGDLRGPVQIASLHRKDDGEVHGLAVCAGRQFAYTARLTTRPGTREPERLLTFRVL